MLHYCLPRAAASQRQLWKIIKVSIMTKKHPPKHRNPLKAATVFLSGPQTINTACAAFTARRSGVYSSLEVRGREWGDFRALRATLKAIE